jgi:hypothetical protein
VASNFRAVQDVVSDELGGHLVVPPDPEALFTWQLPEHRQCDHEFGPTVAMLSGGQKLGFFERCYLLIEPDGSARTPKASTRVQQQMLHEARQ